MPDRIIVDIYARTATEKQPDESNSLEEQEQACRKYCEEHGLAIALVHRDIGSGLEYRERPGLRQLRERYRSGEISGVVFTHTDRLSRSQVHLAILIEEMETHTVAIHTVDYADYDTAQGRLMNAFLAFKREMEAEKHKDDLLDE